MPTISLTLPVAGTTITAGLHSANYGALQALLNAGLDASNFASGKIFAPSKLTQEAATDKQVLMWNNGSAIWAPAGDWATYVPTWTGAGSNPAIGNGTLTGRYAQIGKTVVARIYVSMGTTTTYGTGMYSFSVPVAATASGLAGINGKGIFNRGGTLYPVLGVIQSSTTVAAYTTVSPGVAVTQAAPATWASGDYFTLEFTYEAA